MPTLVPADNGKLTKISHLGIGLPTGCTQLESSQSPPVPRSACARHNRYHGAGVSRHPNEKGLAEFRRYFLHDRASICLVPSMIAYQQCSHPLVRSSPAYFKADELIGQRHLFRSQSKTFV